MFILRRKPAAVKKPIAADKWTPPRTATIFGVRCKWMFTDTLDGRYGYHGGGQRFLVSEEQLRDLSRRRR
jgi:hypothetical protein